MSKTHEVEPAGISPVRRPRKTTRMASRAKTPCTQVEQALHPEEQTETAQAQCQSQSGAWVAPTSTTNPQTNTSETTATAASKAWACSPTCIHGSTQHHCHTLEAQMIASTQEAQTEQPWLKVPRQHPQSSKGRRAQPTRQVRGQSQIGSVVLDSVQSDQVDHTSALQMDTQQGRVQPCRTAQSSQKTTQEASQMSTAGREALKAHQTLVPLTSSTQASVAQTIQIPSSAKSSTSSSQHTSQTSLSRQTPTHRCRALSSKTTHTCTAKGAPVVEVASQM